MSEIQKLKILKESFHSIDRRVNQAFDLDGVLYNFTVPFISWLEQKLSVTINSNDLTDYYWYKCIPGMTEGDFWSEFDKFGQSGAYRSFPTIPDAVESIKFMMANFSVKFITARPEYARDDTYFAMERDFGVTDRSSIIFARGHKSEEILKHSIDIFVEDANHHAMDIATNTSAYVYLMDTPYNKQTTHERIKRVSGWSDIMKVWGV